MYKKLALSKDYVVFISFNSSVFKKDIKSLNMSFINAISFNTWLNKSKKNKSIEIYSIFIHDIEQILQKKKIIDFFVKLFAKYHDHIESFFKKTSNQLSSHRLYDHKIFLIEKIKFVNDFLYEMFKEKLKVMTKYIEKMLKKSFIKINSSSTIKSRIVCRKIKKWILFLRELLTTQFYYH